jgi:Apea-like HEPN
MATISRWVIPCYFTEEKRKTDPLIFDLTSHLKQMLLNEVWNRKFNYGGSSGLKNTVSTDIKSATIKIFPRFVSGYENEKRIPELIKKNCGKIPKHLKLKNYEEWPHYLGLVIIETEYISKTNNIPTKKDLTEDLIPNYEIDFCDKYDRHLAVLKELSSFFLAGLHLSFPTESVMMRNDNPINDGYFQISSGRQTYACKIATNAFMHEILIETSKLSNIHVNLNSLSSVWHYDLWSLNRYLRAVESDQVSIDNLLDLIYSLEGLFDKSTSAEFIKTMCLLNLCKTKKEAKSMKNLLDLAYRIRNEIAHGGLTFDPFDSIKLEGRDILTQTVYWKTKNIVAGMLIKAISKLLNNKEMRNLRFNVDDLINLSFQK